MKGCLIDDINAPCYQGSVSLYAVNVSSPEDIQNAVIFASRHRIRLVIKATGHDFLGRSSAPDSLQIWTKNYDNITFHDSFVPNGCRVKGIPAVTIQAGAYAIDVYAAADAAGVIVVGPAVVDAAIAGGYCQGGGHSPISNKYGLCVDNVLQYKVVDARGRLVIANECQNQDLFWALRGGGGGTFGVVVEATVKTHPPASVIFAYYIVAFTTNDTSIIKSFLTEYTRISVSWSDDGWNGYAYLYSTYLELVYVILDVTEDYALSTFTPLINVANNLGLSMTGELVPFPSFYSFFATIITPSAPITEAFYVLTSRLIPRTVMESDPENLVDTLFYILEQVSPFEIEIDHIAGGEVARLSGKDTSVTPAFRKAIWHVIYYTVWTPTDTWEFAQEQMQALTKLNQKLIDVTPDSGAYMNEADMNEPHYQQSFWGKKNYDRLLKIKRRVDPNGLFSCHECVGSELRD